jgi:hypothetical protein
MTLRMFSIGVEIPGDLFELLTLRSQMSLLDADIVVFSPGIEFYGLERYRNKTLLSAADSFSLVQDSDRWRMELKTAYEAGKTIFVFLSRLEEVYIHTGKKNISGTGRSRVTTDIVDEFSSYSALPLDLGKVVPKRGKQIKVAKALGPLATYWREFGSYSTYEVYFDSPNIDGLLITKTGNKVVGGLAQTDDVAGNIVLLPFVHYDNESFAEYDEESETDRWTKEGRSFGNKLGKALIEIDKTLRLSRNLTPAPDWAESPTFRTSHEKSLENTLESIGKKIEKQRKKRAELSEDLVREKELKRLLYESGSPLEGAVRGALQLLGYEVERFQEGSSEFDAIFTSAEGRYLGEVEGKDRKAVNIDKLSQLERNLQEDFAREEVSEYAKGVLFGNAYRLDPPERRAEFFTEKCLSGANRSGVALVRTTDLFYVGKYLRDHPDNTYAQKCREAIHGTHGGIVELPQCPRGNVNSGQLMPQSSVYCSPAAAAHDEIGLVHA